MCCGECSGIVVLLLLVPRGRRVLEDVEEFVEEWET